MRLSLPCELLTPMLRHDPSVFHKRAQVFFGARRGDFELMRGRRSTARGAAVGVKRKVKRLADVSSSGSSSDSSEEEFVRPSSAPKCRQCGEQGSKGAAFVRCKGCSGRFHPACARTKASNTNWRCSSCRDSDSDDAADSDASEGSDASVVDLDDDSGSVDSHESSCHTCGGGGQLVLCDACPLSFHPKCVNLKGVPKGKWGCPQCIKAGNVDANDDECFVCGDTGDLLCCETCVRAYHLECCDPPLAAIPEGHWSCPRCVTGVSVCLCMWPVAPLFLHDCHQ